MFSWHYCHIVYSPDAFSWRLIRLDFEHKYSIHSYFYQLFNLFTLASWVVYMQVLVLLCQRWLMRMYIDIRLVLFTVFWIISLFNISNINFWHLYLRLAFIVHVYLHCAYVWFISAFEDHELVVCRYWTLHWLSPREKLFWCFVWFMKNPKRMKSSLT